MTAKRRHRAIEKAKKKLETHDAIMRELDRLWSGEGAMLWLKN